MKNSRYVGDEMQKLMMFDLIFYILDHDGNLVIHNSKQERARGEINGLEQM